MFNWMIGKIKGREIRKNKNASTASRILQVQVTGKDDIQSIELVQPAGVDNSPVDGSVVYIAEFQKGWKIGLAANELIAPVSLPGERRLYSVDPLLKTKAAELFLGNDGKISLTNPTSTAELLNLFNDNLTEVITALKFIRDTITFNNGGGATGPPTNGTTLTPVITNLEATQTLLSTLKV